MSHMTPLYHRYHVLNEQRSQNVRTQLWHPIHWPKWHGRSEPLPYLKPRSSKRYMSSDLHQWAIQYSIKPKTSSLNSPRHCGQRQHERSFRSVSSQDGAKASHKIAKDDHGIHVLFWAAGGFNCILKKCAGATRRWRDANEWYSASGSRSPTESFSQRNQIRCALCALMKRHYVPLSGTLGAPPIFTGIFLYPMQAYKIRI